MSRHPLGWDYPAGAEDDPNAPWNERDCYEECPASEYSQPYHILCEGRGECKCFGPGLWNAVKRWWYGDCAVDESPYCFCGEIAADEKDYEDSCAEDEADRRRDAEDEI